MLTFLFLLLVLVATIGLLEYAVPMAAPFRLAIRALVALILLWYLLIVLHDAGVIVLPGRLR